MSTYNVPEEVTLYAERLHYIYEGLKVLMTTFMSNRDLPVNPCHFQKVKQEYLQAYAELSIALRGIYHTYLPPELIDDLKYDYSINFEFNQIIISEKKSCKC